MKKLSKLAAVLMIFVMVFSMTACGNSAEDADTEMGETMAKIKESGKIIMGVNATYAPFEFHKMIDGEDTIVGFDIDLGEAIAEELGVELEVVDMAFDGLVPALAAGKVDFLPGLAWSEERAENADFSIPYHKSLQVILMRTEAVDQITEESDFSGMTVGVLKGSKQETYLPVMYPAAEMEALGKIPDLIAALKSGRIDGVCLDYVVASLYEMANEDLAMSVAQYEMPDELDSGSCVLVRKGNNDDLIAVIDTVLERVIENGELMQWEDDAIALMDMEDIA